MGWDC